MLREKLYVVIYIVSFSCFNGTAEEDKQEQSIAVNI